MQVNERRVNGITVIDLAGRFTATEQPSSLKDRVSRLVASGEKHIILNLGELRYVDSSCLGELVAVYTTAARAGTSIKLASIDAHLQRLLDVTRLSGVLETYDSESAAVASFLLPAI